jgi:hypothetical protein
MNETTPRMSATIVTRSDMAAPFKCRGHGAPLLP